MRGQTAENSPPLGMEKFTLPIYSFPKLNSFRMAFKAIKWFFGLFYPLVHNKLSSIHHNRSSRAYRLWQSFGMLELFVRCNIYAYAVHFNWVAWFRIDKLLSAFNRSHNLTSLVFVCFGSCLLFAYVFCSLLYNLPSKSESWKMQSELVIENWTGFWHSNSALIKHNLKLAWSTRNPVVMLKMIASLLVNIWKGRMYRFEKCLPSLPNLSVRIRSRIVFVMLVLELLATWAILGIGK